MATFKNKKRRKKKKATELIARVASNIKKFRMNIGLTQEQLQAVSGILIGRCETGKQDMTLTTINTLSKHLQVKPYELLK